MEKKSILPNYSFPGKINILKLNHVPRPFTETGNLCNPGKIISRNESKGKYKYRQVFLSYFSSE